MFLHNYDYRDVDDKDNDDDDMKPVNQVAYYLFCLLLASPPNKTESIYKEVDDGNSRAIEPAHHKNIPHTLRPPSVVRRAIIIT